MNFQSEMAGLGNPSFYKVTQFMFCLSKFLLEVKYLSQIIEVKSTTEKDLTS